MKRSFTTKIICYKKNDQFLAVALNFDLIDEGDCMGEALSRLEENIVSYLIMCVKEKENDESIYRKAPKKYFDLHGLFVELQGKKAENKFLGELTFNRDKLVKHTCCNS